jgi:ATP diphosphatase
LNSPAAILEDLLYLMARLRDPDNGCPWDCEQDFLSIAPHTLEECFELVDTIERGDFDHLREELGDVLFQVIFYCQMAEEQQRFDFQQVAAVLLEKLVRRHPHVFPDGTLRGEPAAMQGDPASIVDSWERIKQQERRDKARHGILADIPLALPALIRAKKLQKRAAGAGFDWRAIPGVLDKVREETEELQQDIDSGNAEGIAEELGDLLFSVVNLARHLELDPETVLRGANRKFEQRFHRMEARLATGSSSFAGLSDEELDQLWQYAKQN